RRGAAGAATAQLGPPAAPVSVRTRGARDERAGHRRSRRSRAGPGADRVDAQPGPGVGGGGHRGNGMTEGLFLRAYRVATGIAATGASILSVLPGRGASRHALRQRLGRLDKDLLGTVRSNPILWVHAASVGELNAVRPLLGRLRDRYPERICLVTTLTA